MMFGWVINVVTDTLVVMLLTIRMDVEEIEDVSGISVGIMYVIAFQIIELTDEVGNFRLALVIYLI